MIGRGNPLQLETRYFLAILQSAQVFEKVFLIDAVAMCVIYAFNLSLFERKAFLYG